MFLPATSTLAEEKATPNEVYELILSAVPVLQQLGEQDLVAFNDPKGEFVYKDTYVLVHECEKMVMAAHPNPKLVGFDLNKIVDKNPDPAKRKNQSAEMAEISKRPNGGWVEYYWEMLGSTEPARKISFAIQVPGTNSVLIAGIDDDSTSVDELNAAIK